MSIQVDLGFDMITDNSSLHSDFLSAHIRNNEIYLQISTERTSPSICRGTIAFEVATRIGCLHNICTYILSLELSTDVRYSIELGKL